MTFSENVKNNLNRNFGGLEVKYGLPSEVVFCKKCVISNQRPITTLEVEHDESQKKPTTNFDEDGVCDACRWAEYKEEKIDWEERERHLKELLNRYRSPNGDYDVVVPVSGGKDSCYVAHLLKEKYKMNPLTVTWAPHIYTEPGWRNLQSFINSGFDNILTTPNGKVHRLLTKLAFEKLGHAFQPFILGQRNIAPKIALKNNIKLVFYGENVAEYGNRIEDNLHPQMEKLLYTSIDICNDDLFISGVTIKELKEKYSIQHSDLIPYGSPSMDEIESNEIEFHYMSFYKKWIPQDNYYYAVRNTGFQPNDERTQGSYSKYSSFDDKIDSFHYYMTYIKFGMGRAVADASQEIRTGKISRDEGVALVNRYDHEFPSRYYKEFLDYIDITDDEFKSITEVFRSPHLWKKEDDQWVLRHKIK